MTSVWMKRGALTLFAAVAITLAPAGADVRAAARLPVNVSPASAAAGGQGRATLVVRRLGEGANGTLTVLVRKLAPSTTLDVMADGVRIGTLTTNKAGNGRARFRTHPRGNDQLLSVNPRPMAVGVLAPTPDPEHRRRHDDEGDQVRCCVTDDDENDCQQLSADRCQSKNGMMIGRGSCDPNPCPPPGTTRCCLPEDDDDEEGNGVECKQRTPDRCHANGGTDMGAGVCDDSVCPQPQVIQCCVPDEEDDEDGSTRDCRLLTADRCDKQHGMNLGTGSCKPNPCGNVSTTTTVTTTSTTTTTTGESTTTTTTVETTTTTVATTTTTLETTTTIVVGTTTTLATTTTTVAATTTTLATTTTTVAGTTTTLATTTTTVTTTTTLATTTTTVAETTTTLATTTTTVAETTTTLATTTTTVATTTTLATTTTTLATTTTTLATTTTTLATTTTTLATTTTTVATTTTTVATTTTTVATTTTTVTTTTTTVTTTTTTTTSTTTTTIGPTCTCAGGTPTKTRFTTGVGSGNCGSVDEDANPDFAPLLCGGLYFGGSGVAVPLPSKVPDQGSSIANVSCNGTTLTVSGATPAQAGGNRCSGGSNHHNACTTSADCPGGTCKFLQCTASGCLFGPPLPVPNSAHGGASTSTCVVNVLSADASGTADCNTGSTSGLSVPLSSQLFLTADLLPMRCSGGSTPGAGCSAGTGGCGTIAAGSCPGGTCANDTGRCTAPDPANRVCCSDADCIAGSCETGNCTAGTNLNNGCITDADCGTGGVCRTFIQPCPICNSGTLTCNGGANDGLACTPGDGALDGDFPTSHDCPPPAASNIGSLPIAFVLDTGAISKTAVDMPSQVNVFCKFCRNKTTNQSARRCNGSPTGLSCACNPGVPCAACSGAPCLAVPCNVDADCSTVTGFVSCQQRTAGAFSATNVTRTIHETGSPAGALTTGGPAKPATLASIFCIPPSFTAVVDSAADLPGPGAVSLPGTTQNLP